MNWFPSNCGGGCCESVERGECLFFEDDFEDGTIDPRWTQDAGTWTEANGYIETSDANARLLQGLPHEPKTRSRVRIQGTNNGDVARVFGRYASTNEFVQGEIEFGAAGEGKLRIRQENLGAPVASPVYCFTDHAQTGQWINVEFCLGVEYAALTIFDGAWEERLAYIRMDLESITGGGGPGLGTWGTPAGVIRFDDWENFRLYETGQWAHCPRCARLPFCHFGEADPFPGRAFFKEGLTPPRWTLVIQGVTAESCTTGECGLLNAAYVMEQPDSCSPVHEEIQDICESDITRWEVRLFFAQDVAEKSLSVRALLVEYDDPNGREEDIAFWRKDYPDGVEAIDLNATDIPLFDDTPAVCNAAAATAELTSEFS